MKAAVVSQFGGPDMISIGETDRPVPKSGQVLVKVMAASINPFDIAVRSGVYKDSIPVVLPYVIGGDFAGTVETVSEGTEGYAKGNAVFGSANVVNGGSGSMAEYAVANTANINIKPSTLGMSEAAAMPLVGSSAIQAVSEEIGLKSGQRILIHGGAGGIGSVAIQLAKHLGAYVATTVSREDFGFVKGLGADEVIDYMAEKFEDKLVGFDAVYDTVGGEVANRSFKVLKKGGVIASMKGHPDSDLAAKLSVRAIAINTRTDSGHLAKLKELLDSGKLKPQIDKTFPFASAREAFMHQEKNHPNGKVVITVQ